MSLYRYIPNREHLIDNVVDLVVDELYAEPRCCCCPPAAGRITCAGSRTGCAGWRSPIPTCSLATRPPHGFTTAERAIFAT